MRFVLGTRKIVSFHLVSNVLQALIKKKIALVICIELLHAT